MENITDFISVGVIGAVLSLVIDWAKVKFGTETSATKLLTIALSIIVGLVYVYFRTTPWWSTILTTLGASSTVYALFLKK